MGPVAGSAPEVYLRTATTVDRSGWANFGFTRMPDYRWGVFLADPEPDRRVGFGDHKGEPVWQRVPGDYRAALRRLIVIQGDTEPASVEQQRHLGRTCPSGTTCATSSRSTSRRDATSGRWSTCSTPTSAATDARRRRRCWNAAPATPTGPASSPPSTSGTPDWLALFMFTFLTDRDGKFQLHSLAESAFDPLARTCRFMLTEEAHHMFVGITGLARVAQRTCEVMREHDTGDVRRFGVIDLPTFQRYLNFHFSVTLDLFGAEISTNAAGGYTGGLKGRFHESDIDGRPPAEPRHLPGPAAGGRRVPQGRRPGPERAQRATARGLRRGRPDRHRPGQPHHPQLRGGLRAHAPARRRSTGGSARSPIWTSLPGARSSTARPGAVARRSGCLRIRIAPTSARSCRGRSPSPAGSPTGSLRLRGASTTSRSTSSTCGSTEPPRRKRHEAGAGEASPGARASRPQWPAGPRMPMHAGRPRSRASVFGRGWTCRTGSRGNGSPAPAIHPPVPVFSPHGFPPSRE